MPLGVRSVERYLIGLGTSPSRGHDCTCMLRRSDALHARPRALLEPLQGPREHLATRAFTCAQEKGGNGSPGRGRDHRTISKPFTPIPLVVHHGGAACAV
eukprot:scaffold84201_cov32-Tisochrysis_lutea.AAC.4